MLFLLWFLQLSRHPGKNSISSLNKNFFMRVKVKILIRNA